MHTTHDMKIYRKDLNTNNSVV